VYGLLLRQLDFPCVALHSLMSQVKSVVIVMKLPPSVFVSVLQEQGQRLASLARFKSGQVRILVATDVASRSEEHVCCLH